MLDDVSDIAKYYNDNLHGEHDRLIRHQLEYDLTWWYLDEYLPPKGRILEVGAATGRYTLELARRGYRVTAVDLSPVELETCRENVTREGLEEHVALVVADARDLGQVTERDFDAVLLMGPLYHLVEEADRRLALREVYARLREGGVLFSAFISRYGILGDLIRKVPEWIEYRADVESLFARGRGDDNAPPGSFRGYFATVGEITPLHEGVGFETIKLVGVEPAISADDESYNMLDGERRKLWLDLLYEVSTEPSILAASRHLLYVGRKKGGVKKMG
ncbi:MAG: class I SAM-dependent methyltransferase [Anaerolineales bacterium]|nr:class I SAM-dependent methyltransferase [Anaerolineales bacterium]